MKKNLLILFLFCTLTITAKDFDLVNLTNSDGLSNSSINVILQDTSGLTWLGTWDGLNMYNGRDFKTFKPETGNSNSISNNIIRDILEENKQILWITTDRGINRYDKETNKFTRFFTETNASTGYGENSFFVAKNNSNQIFACIYERGLYYYNASTQKFQPVKINSGLNVKKLFFDLDNNLWVLTSSQELVKVVFRKGSTGLPTVEKTVIFSHLKNIESVFCKDQNELWMQASDEKLYIYRISEGLFLPQALINTPNGRLRSLVFREDDLLMGTENGLFRYTPSTSHTEIILANLPVLSVFTGIQDIIWVGTDAQGVMQLSPPRQIFNAYTAANIPGFGRSAVRTFFEPTHKNLWVGTKGSGIYCLSWDKSGQAPVIEKHYTTTNGLLSNSIFTIVQGIAGEGWIGTDGNGVNYFDVQTKKINRLNVPSDMNLTSVYAILFTSPNTMWVGTSGNGLFKIEIDRSTQPYSVRNFRHYIYRQNQKTSLSNNIVYAIEKADDTHLWVGTRGGGLNRLSINTEQFETFRFSDNNPDLISSDDILSLHSDNKGVLWAGTSMGLIKLKGIKNGKPDFERFTEKEGMPNNTIHGILEDKNNDLWLTTNKGLTKLIQEKSNIRLVSYFQKDGLQNNEFSDGAFYKSAYNENFYIGGISGFNAFDPQKITNSKYMPALVLDAFYVDNTRKELSEFLKKTVEKTVLQISYKIKSFSFIFVPVDYLSGSKCEISYKLDGYQKDWIHLGTSGTIVFSNLPRGNYLLKVRCSNADKVWSDDYYTLPVVIQPPWWATNVAYLSYFVLLMLIVFGVSRIVITQRKARNEIKMKELEKQKTEEIHQAKLRFFTNIAHEFSNSLTLIYGPSVQLLKDRISDPRTRKYLQTIKQNSERMQFLIQQLIDFRKAETGYLKPKFTPVDVTELLKYVTDNFSEALEQKKITLKLNTGTEPIRWNTDRDCVEKIIFNLLSNAVKYTPAHKQVEVTLSVKDNMLFLNVKNYGVGIKATHIQSVFNRFEVLDRLERQASQGLETRNGIGLALCKNLTEVLNGSIEVESDGETFTSFVVLLPQSDISELIVSEPAKSIEPVTNEEFTSEKQETNIQTKYSVPDDKKEGLILVIDDDRDIRRLICDFLSYRFEVVEAGNGREAIEAMKVRMPVLIICDVIMPEMNGVEFVRIIKKQELTRHIPIIMLSTKASVESQIEGLETGADAYLGKPFHPRHLEALIDSQLQRNKAVLEFSESAYASMEQFDGKLIKKEDNDLILRITKLVIEHIDDENLTLDGIAAEMAISKMQLYRKLKELIDQTPTEFIRGIRLNHAEKLLKTTNKTVQEIMYDCGFSNKAYFYREFAKKFNQTPGEYRGQK